MTNPAERHPFLTAFALSLGAAIALGLSRFSYGLLLLPMRLDLGWSYLLAGAVFLSVVTSSTALVRHNLPASAWSTGISMFTTVFALGQIVGPTAVGWIADGAGGLERGLVFSALALFAGALLALVQRH